MRIWTFIEENYFMLFYALTLFVSLATYRKYYDTALKYFPIIIAYTLLNEILGFLIREYDDIQIIYSVNEYYQNALIFNVFDLVFYLYFYYIY